MTPSGHTVDATRRLSKQFWRVVVPLTLFACVNSTDTLLLQRSSELGLSVMAVVFAYVLYNVVYASLSYPAGKLADRVPARLVFAGGLAVFAVVYIGLGVATSSAAVWTWHGNGRTPLTVSGIVAVIVAAWLLVTRGTSDRHVTP